jgi:hypothetical protein
MVKKEIKKIKLSPMYLYSTITDRQTILQQPIFRGKDKEIEIEKIEEVQVWASSFTDADEDYCELRVIGKKGNQMRKEVVQGY